MKNKKGIIDRRMIVLYVLEGCPYCERALQMLKMEKIKHKKVVVPRDEEKKNEYKRMCEMETFPMIFIRNPKAHGENEYLKIGGSSDLEAYIQKSKEFSQSNIPMDTFYAFYSTMFSNKKNNKK